jgi:FtsH-binding integral membrane protein
MQRGSVMSSKVPEKQLYPAYGSGCHRAAATLTTAGISVLALFAMLISFAPTSRNWDPEMPEFGDPDAVLFALLFSGTGLFLAIAVLLILRQYKSAWIAYLVFAGLNGYRFVTLALHFQG